MAVITRPPARSDMTDEEVQNRIDRWLLAGCILCGTFIFAIPGFLIFLKSYRMIRQAKAEGRVVRPDIITIIGVTCLVDAAINWLMWCVDFFPAHDTVLGRTLFTGFGRLWDGAYYLGYDTTAVGGTAVSSEKSWEFMGVLIMYPMRLVSGWGFLKMKRWGFQFFLISAYLYAAWWIGYVYQFTHQFDWRMTHTAWGAIGWWLIDGIYLTPFLMIPYLHTVNRELWSD